MKPNSDARRITRSTPQLLGPSKKGGKFKAIILDCPPALGMLSMNGPAAADYLLIALQCEYLALEGLGQPETMEQIKSAEPIKSSNLEVSS